MGGQGATKSKPKEAKVPFRRVLELHGKSFATIKGLDPEAGAHLNLGSALLQMGRADEAHSHWLQALRRGTYESARQAMFRLASAGGRAKLPPAAEIDLTFGETLATHGRAREAALR